jgi:hypothetical protein
MKYLKVEGHTNLIRDQFSNAILNTNTTEYDNYVSLKKTKQSETKRIEILEDKVSVIGSDLKEIKNLLRSLINES